MIIVVRDGVPESSRFGGDGWFGDAADGDLSVAAGTTKLTASKSFGTVTVAVGGILDTDGYLLICRTLINNGTVMCGGNFDRTYAGGVRPMLGNTGGTVAGGVGAGTAGVQNSVTYGGGGAGGSGTGGAGGAAAAALNASALWPRPGVKMPEAAMGVIQQGATLSGFRGGCSGGAGGGNGAAIGGAGGAGGGVLVVDARDVINNGLIHADGGAGGAGAAANCGGGGGGGGGVASVNCRSYAGALPTANGGLGGASGGAAGVIGSAGTGGIASVNKV